MNVRLLLLLTLFTLSCKDKGEVVYPQQSAITESVYASGLVKSKNQYQCYSTVAGRISHIFVTEGDSVKKGDAIIQIQSEASYYNALNATLAAANNAMGNNQQKLSEAKVNSDLAFSKMKSDSLLWQRQQNLYSQNIGTLVELEQRALAYKNSSTSYAVAQLHINDLNKQLQFAANQSNVNAKLTKAQAGDYIIRSSLDGKVYKILKEVGEYVNTLAPVATLGDARSFYLELQVDEYDIVRIQLQQTIAISMDSYKGKMFEAIITKIEPLMNEDSRSFTLEAEFKVPPHVLYPNLSVEANIIIAAKAKTITIPRTYLTSDSMVYISKKEKRKVVVGLSDFQKAEILKGLAVTDKIYKPNP
jgi:HlyD family secretion protein